MRKWALTTTEAEGEGWPSTVDIQVKTGSQEKKPYTIQLDFLL